VGGKKFEWVNGQKLVRWDGANKQSCRVTGRGTEATDYIPILMS
jgi:hypothetical protein